MREREEEMSSKENLDPMYAFRSRAKGLFICREGVKDVRGKERRSRKSWLVAKDST